MMLLYVLQICLTAITAGVIGGVTIIILACIVYFVSTVISSCVQTFKDVRAKQKANKFMKALNDFSKAWEAEKQKKDSR